MSRTAYIERRQSTYRLKKPRLEARSAGLMKKMAKAKVAPTEQAEPAPLPFDSTMLPDEVFDLRVPPADQRWAVIARRIASL